MEGVAESEKNQTAELNGKPTKMLALYEDVHHAFRQFLLDEKIPSANEGVRLLLSTYKGKRKNGGGVHN